MIQITSRMFHVEFGCGGGIVCIFVKIVMLIWRSHFYLPLQGGLLGKELFESSTSSNLIKLSTRISHYYENIFDVKRPPVRWHLRWQERINALLILPCLQQHSGNISSSVFYIGVHITNLSFLYNRLNVPTLTAKILYFLYDN